VRTYVSTLGFHSTRATRPILDHGLDSGDRILLLQPEREEDTEETSRAEKAIRDIEDLVEQIDPEIRVTVEQLSTTDFATTVRACLDVLAAAEGDVVAVFGGGPREIFLPFTVATLVRRDLITDALQFSDIDGSVREIPLPDLLTPIPPKTLPTLELVAEQGGETTLPKLSEASEQTKGTVGRHLNALEDAGAVETTQEGQTRLVGLTLAGEMRLDHQ
jgi:CRISPR-associated protein Csa3